MEVDYFVLNDALPSLFRKHGFLSGQDINLQMRGEGFPQKALNEIIKREELSRNRSNDPPCIPT